jgi:Family of unknown function (DUF6600)
MKEKPIPKRFVSWSVLALCAALIASTSPARAQGDEDDALGFERTPPRLSFIDGDVSFWRSGAEDWTEARVNIALAAGDELYTDEGANLELQVGARSFVRAGETTQLGLTSLEPDFLQLRVTTGHVSLDLRSLKAGQTFELDTPNAAFSVEHSGYYRVEVEGDVTTFTSRRGGRARVIPASGEPTEVAASEQVVVIGTDAPQIESYAAPELDAWDRWNYARTDDQLDAVSARYVPPAVYGAYDLDHYGDWRVLPTYGAVWVPRRVAVGWAPYSTGRWIFDPFYGWTWVDDAPWGWAPYHYGRWVHVSGFWGWCPGPVVVRPLYAPALVAFYGGGGISVGVTIGRPHLGWVALGWGEPLVPWWGPPRFREHAHWAGWRGPRVVNGNVIKIKNKTVYKAKEINIYENTRVRGAIVEVDRDHFGRRSGKDQAFTRAKAGKLSPLHGDLGVKPDRSSLVAEKRAGKRPPENARHRSVVATREPRLDPEPRFEARRTAKGKPEKGARGAELGAPETLPPARVAKPPREGKRSDVARRAPFGKQSETERSMPPLPPRYKRPDAERRSEPAPDRSREKSRERGQPADVRGKAGPGIPRNEGRPEVVAPAPPERGAKASRARGGKPPSEGVAPSPKRERAAPRQLPGEPANRVYRGQRAERQGRMDRESGVRAERPRNERSQPTDAGGGGGGGGKGRDKRRDGSGGGR